MNPQNTGTGRRQKGSRGLILAAIAVVLAGLVVVGLVFGRDVAKMFADDDYDGAGTGEVTVVVEPGQMGSQIGTTLTEAGVIKTQQSFIDALAANPGDEIQAGTYKLRSQMSAGEALALMRSGGRSVQGVTVREGLWKSEVFDVLSKATGTPVAEYEKAATAAESDPSLLGLPASAKGKVEGYLFPATYEFNPGASATEQMRTMVNHATTRLKELGVNEADAERIITIASLVEAEARMDQDRPKVSRVIYNRLDEPMRLQMDSTVNYAVQKRSITTSDAERANANPYNTYYHDGLPPGPVGNPGASAIDAAKNPAEGPWLYFVTVNPHTGETIFTNTLAEHNKAVLQFQKWCQDNPGTC
ncbi:MAG: endolytic transglycosylase MltG [Dermatophilus congolensis]|nr:endolytic transglycosylase MltG [Dermatophilus congolensis]